MQLPWGKSARLSQGRPRKALLTVLVLTATGLACVGWGSAWLSRFRAVVPGRIYRSGQPTMAQLSGWIDHWGLRTIVDLRGSDAPLASQEGALAASKGVHIAFVGLGAYSFISPERLRELIDVLDHADRPLLLHCHHGVDRAGTASAIAAFLEGQPYASAKGQAFVLPGPWKRRRGPVHISDTLKLYEDYCRDHSLNPGAPARFRDWATNVYGRPYAESPPSEPAGRTSPLTRTLAHRLNDERPRLDAGPR